MRRSKKDQTYEKELNRLAKEGKKKAIEWAPVDPEEMQKRFKEAFERDKQQKEEHIRQEQQRITDLQCPACKSTNKNHHEKRNDNGIIGPGYSSWIIEEYYVCKECGCMFKDLNKPQKSYFND